MSLLSIERPPLQPPDRGGMVEAKRQRAKRKSGTVIALYLYMVEYIDEHGHA
jgi:hypothetical protein